MHRNLDRRVEVLCQMSDTETRKHLRTMLDLAFAADTAAWELQPDGSWTHLPGSDYQLRLMRWLSARGE
jgi:polyphosphate kinase